MPTSEEQDYFKPAHEQYHQLIKTLSADSNQGWEHGEVERYIQDAKTVIGSAFREALQRDPHHQQEWVVLVDGEPHQLNTIEALAKQQAVVVTIVLDFIHVLEYVWKAAFCFFPSGSEAAEAWVQERAQRIVQGQASAVAAGIRRSATKQNLSSKTRENADKCADYLLKYRQYLRYDDYLEKGYPIASGVIEGTCRPNVNDRMDITGARWRLDRAEAVLRLRALREAWGLRRILAIPQTAGIPAQSCQQVSGA